MTFKVTGLGFMFADLLCRGFGYLHPLFICSKGEFHQKTYDGLVEIVKSDLNVETIKRFFESVYEYFVFYSKMDFQFTNLTYLYVEENPIIAENLKRIAEFKDIARVWVNSVSIDDDCLLNQLISKIGEKFEVNGNDLDSYKITEIFALFDGMRVDKEILRERSQSSLAYTDGQNLKYAWGKEAEEFVEQVKPVYATQANADIVGQVANKGEDRYVIGRVARINVDYSSLELMEQNIAKMEPGEILVSEFTAPELIGACNKAKAIITDLGGMLSHAAIVSGELNIPCIVGTEHASRSLKNGDMIKIDVQLGTVEKI